MNVKNWTKDFEGKLRLENDANDYYYEWVSLNSKEYGSLHDLFEDILDLTYHDTNVRIKTFDGAIFIQRIGDDE